MTAGKIDDFPTRPVYSAKDLADPLAFLEGQHAWQSKVCAWIDQLVEALEQKPITQEAKAILAFLTEDLELHIRDEEEDLFPLLKTRAERSDRIGSLLSRLSHEHELDQDLVGFIIEDLRLITEHKIVPNLTRFCVNLSGFAENQRRHLAWENATILPLAQKRLSSEDLAALSQSMAKRRNIALN